MTVHLNPHESVCIGDALCFVFRGIDGGAAHFDCIPSEKRLLLADGETIALQVKNLGNTSVDVFVTAPAGYPVTKTP